VYRAFSVFIGKDTGPVEAVPITEDSRLREHLYPYRGEQPRPEEDEARWMDEYDKILVERAVLNAPDMDGTVLRLPMVYGPGDYQHRFLAYVKRMDDGRPTILLGEQQAAWRSCWGYVEDVARAIAAAVTDSRAAGQTYNVAGRATPSMAAWVNRIAEYIGWEGQVHTLPEDRLPAHLKAPFRWDQDLIMSADRLNHDLDFAESVSFEDGLARTIAWERLAESAVAEAGLDYAAEDEVVEASEVQ
jgi:nucleoside-diphosphate-sugar epimerase